LLDGPYWAQQQPRSLPIGNDVLMQTHHVRICIYRRSIEDASLVILDANLESKLPSIAV
jgi:hypothetical protein